MADGIYIGMAGAAARETQLDAIADNLANAETPGFKAARPAFEAFLPGSDPDAPASPAIVGGGLDMRPGAPMTTGNPLDVTPGENQFLGVRMGDQIAYTRNGKITVSAEGLLQTAGYPLLSTTGQPITVPLNTHVQISPEGVVQITGQGEDGDENPQIAANVDQIALYHFTGTPQRVAPSLYAGPAEQVAEDTGKLRIGEVEMGNVSPIESAVQLVTAQRAFDSSMRVIETYTQMSQASSQVGKVS
jgi:flagellar basal-body rod protein FlgF